jgi:hypothetical protein
VNNSATRLLNNWLASIDATIAAILALVGISS